MEYSKNLFKLTLKSFKDTVFGNTLKISVFILSKNGQITEEKHMPQITTFMYSEGTVHEQIPNGQRLHIVSPLITFRPIFVPGTFSFSVNVGILDIDIEKEHTLQIKFLSPLDSDAPVVDSGVIPLPRNVDPTLYEIPPEMRGLMLNLGFQNVIFRTEGIYKTEVIFDGDILGEFPIHVKGKEKLI